MKDAIPGVGGIVKHVVCEVFTACDLSGVGGLGIDRDGVHKARWAVGEGTKGEEDILRRASGTNLRTECVRVQDAVIERRGPVL